VALFLGLDLNQPVGSRLSPLAVAEIQAVAPSVVVNNSITTAKMRDEAITTPKLANGAVTTEKIQAQGVQTANLKDGSVTTAKLATAAVTKANAGTGMVTGSYSDGTAASFDVVPLSAAEYAQRTPLAGTVYLILA